MQDDVEATQTGDDLRQHPLWVAVPAVRFEARFGKTPRAKARNVPPVAESPPAVTGKATKPRKAKGPSVGTTLVRTWRGRQYQLRVLETGFELEGVLHKSLSAAAAALTGQHWNGRLFWGLVSRRKVR